MVGSGWEGNREGEDLRLGTEAWDVDDFVNLDLESCKRNRIIMREREEIVPGCVRGCKGARGLSEIPFFTHTTIRSSVDIVHAWERYVRMLML